MKRFQSILCASLLTLSISSATLAGNISGKDGNISGAPTSDGNISGIAGNISGFTDEAYDALVDLLNAILL
jgi:hypothetical protein